LRASGGSTSSVTINSSMSLGDIVDAINAQTSTTNVQASIVQVSSGSYEMVLTGTTALDQLEPALDLDKPIDLAMFNAAFEPARTEFDWLSRDEAIVDAYIADPRCGFGIDTDAAKDMFAGARRVADPGQVAAVRSDLPLYIAAGELDPVNANLALLNVLAGRYRAAGLTDVTVRTYPGARHEILNETNRDQVVADILEWIDQVLSKP